MSADNKLSFLERSNSRESSSPFDPANCEITKTPIDIVNTTATSRKSSIDVLDSTIVFPEYICTIKEKECWLLYQKMTNKGISVSYETILRGVLTPSEYRAIDRKQKEIAERQANIDNEGTTECDNKKINGNNKIVL